MERWAECKLFVFPCIRFEEGIGRKDNAVEAVRLFAAQSPQFSF